jgi:hypothetical protein
LRQLEATSVRTCSVFRRATGLPSTQPTARRASASFAVLALIAVLFIAAPATHAQSSAPQFAYSPSATFPSIFVGVVLTPPSPSLNPSSPSFAQTTVGSTASQNFTITDTGTETLTISSIAIGGPNPGDFTQSNNCGGSVTGSALCTVTVVFQPQAAGQRTATARINTNGGMPTVALTGLAVAATPPLTVAPSGPTTATVQPGQPATYGANFTPSPTFSGTATFTCTVAPAGPDCTASPSMLQVTASNNPATTPVTATATPPATASYRQHALFIGRSSSRNFTGFTRGEFRWPLALFGFALLAIFVLAKTSLAAAGSRRLQFSSIASVLAIAVLCFIASCGGSGSTGTQPQTQSYTLTLTTTAGTATQSVDLTLTVQ